MFRLPTELLSVDSRYTDGQRTAGCPEKKNWLVREKKLSRYVPDSSKRLQTRIVG